MNFYRLVNLASDGLGVRYKQSSMPFVQMENISHFLRACQSSPLNLQPHDLFQTVDLYEAKDPAQVLQCIGAFSRRAHAVQPAIFGRAIGVQSKGYMSPQVTGGNIGPNYSRERGISSAGTASFVTPNRASAGSISPVRSPKLDESTSANGRLSSSPAPGISSWSKRIDEAVTTPAWNIHQYGYMGGASQGNQGISFGGRRQITTPAPKVPSLAEKERRRREADAESERRHILAEEAERKQQIEQDAEEKRNQKTEERQAQQMGLQEEQNAALAKEEKDTSEEAEIRRRRSEDSLLRVQDSSPSADDNIHAIVGKGTERRGAGHDARLQGQYLSQYQAEQRKPPPTPNSRGIPPTTEHRRIEELEQQLERAGQPETTRPLEDVRQSGEPQYEHSRDRISVGSNAELDDSARSFRYESQDRSSSKPRPLPQIPSDSHQNGEKSWHATERDYLRQEWAAHQNASSDPNSNSLSSQEALKPPRPLPTPQPLTSSLPIRSLPIPQPTPPPRTIPPFPTKPSSLLAREMERDRIRQQEWEEAQQATEIAASHIDANRKDGATIVGTKPGEGAWDVNQYGYLGGDNQNRGGPGLGFGAARRQIIGPRVEVRKG